MQAQLEHPCVVPVYEVARDDAGSAYFTMRKVDGIALDEVIRLKRAGDRAIDASFTRHRLLTAFAQVCLTIDYAHSRGVLHRDLKPANVMFGDFGEVYLIDWGVAKLTADDTTAPVSSAGATVAAPGDKTQVGSALGTPAYMAPEQLAGTTIDERADVFSLGALLFEILTLEQLFDEAALTARVRGAHATWDARPSVRAPAMQVPPEFDRICVRATAEAVQKRFGSARSLHDAIEAYLGGERDLELRHRLAAEHLARAEASRGSDPDTALREVNRALALAPGDARGLELLVELLRHTREGAAGVAKAKKDVVSETIERLRRAQPLGALLFVAPWITVYPVMLALRGYWSPWLALATPLAWVIAGITILVDHRQGTQERVIYPTVALMTAVAMTSLVFGPLFVMPALAATTIGNHVLVSARHLRIISVVMVCAAVVVPTLMAWLGIHDVYRFESETTFVLHSVFERIHPPNLSATLTVVDLIMLISAAVFAGQFRDEIERARTANVLFAWQLSKLLPASPSNADVTAPVSARSTNTATAEVERILDTEIDVGSGRALAGQTKHSTLREGHSDGDDATAPPALLALEGPRYAVRGPLSLGPSASVERCRDRLIGRDVAMKRLRPELCGRADMEPRFTREATLQARLDHPAVPPLYDLGRDARGPWFTTKLVRGSSLAELFAAGAADEHVRRRHLAALAQVCLAVDFAHDRGCVHGALDPQAIVLGEFGEVYVTGWSETKTAPALEGASYIAPEQAAGGRVDPRTDVFSLGVILYETVAGRPLFAGDARFSLVLGKYDARPSALPGASGTTPALDDLIRQATAYAPDDRHASARDVHDAIQAFLSRDRDDEVRRSLAAERMARAEKSAELALTQHDEPSRIDALRQLGRALALTPDRAPALRLLEKLVASPPSPLPAEVVRETAAQSWAMSRRAAGSVAKVYALAWLVAFPLGALAMGVREPMSVVAIALAWAVAAATLYVQHVRGAEPARVPWPSFAGLFAVGVTSLLFGPHILVPTLAIAMTMGYVLGGRVAWRRRIVAAGCAAVLLPGALTWLGVLHAYGVAGDTGRPTIILKGAVHHPPTLLLFTLMAANLAAVLIAAAYAARFRDTLEAIEAETRAKVLALSRLVA
ncbi:MAG: eukaryotic-like serine/threonine-protein kinase [Myxococcales bacterium]|nr:eukaryotic-like serine/threonine-protein kinase [Myxococcales bacterium]